MNNKNFSDIRYLITGLLVLCFTAPATAQEHPSWATGTWHTLESEEGPIGRHEHGYVQLGELFYLVGGRGERPVQTFDPETNTWTTLGLPPLELHHFQPVVYGDKIYVVGAFTGGWPTETPVPDIYVYDPATDVWTQGPAIPADRRRGAAGLVVYEDHLYLVSGIQNGHTDGHVTWFDRYNPATEEWSPLSDTPRARDHFHAVVIDNKLYVAGGRRSSYGTGQSLELTVPEIDVYDFATETWETLPASANLPTQRAGTTALHYHGQLVVIGGESPWGIAMNPDSPPAHSEVEALNPQSATWLSMTPLSEGLHAMQAILYNDKIYIASGSRTVGATEVSTQIVYTPSH